MMTIEEIKQYIPHRYPFLLVDRVLEMTDESIVTIKNVTVNEEFFNGHFPGAPIMPGVLQIEAMAQSGCIIMLKTKVEDPSKVMIVFSAINKAKFRRPVVPGDQLRMEVKLVEQRRNFVTMAGKATVDGQLTCELEATAALVDRSSL
jgi:3-hydroxyacyl-[acyl-carrier-protein] dehydratase